MMTFDIGKQQQDERFEIELDRLSALVADMAAIRRGVPPQCRANGAAPALDRWVMARRTIPCLADCLRGTGRLIATSDVWLLPDDRIWARTLSRWYRLGRPAGHAADHA